MVSEDPPGPPQNGMGHPETAHALGGWHSDTWVLFGVPLWGSQTCPSPCGVTLFGVRVFGGCPPHHQFPRLPEAQFRLSILERLEQLETRLGALPPPAPLLPPRGAPSETPPEQVRSPPTPESPHGP